MRVGTNLFRSLNWRGNTRLVALLLVISFSDQSANANVFEDDDRRPVNEEDDLAFVGVIACTNTARLPTASLITIEDADPDRRFDILITVAHAFSRRDGKRWDECDFHPGGDPERAAPIVYVVSGTETPGQGWNTDWAVAVLARRISDNMSLPHPLSLDEATTQDKIDNGAHILLVGHNGEKLPMLVSNNCRPRIKTSGSQNLGDDRVFNHDCDMMAGWSGGPLLLRESNATYAIAVNSTQFNRVVHQQGWPFDGRFNPNTAIRIDAEFEETIRELAITGAPVLLADKMAFCAVETTASCQTTSSEGVNQQPEVELP